MERSLGSSAEAGYVITITAFSGILAGATSSKLYVRFGRKTYAYCSGIVAVSYFLVIFAANFWMIAIAALGWGYSFHTMQTAMFLGIGEDIPGPPAEATIGMVASLMNLFSFLATYALSFMSALTGNEGSMTAPFYFALVYFLLFLVVSLLMYNKKNVALSS
jgi:MFS family permease